ncbi:hypothetical protein CHARACLAT_020435 [Characodon lateralis]|uniref:Uncharacterized protein n=1 Tax=Characodon lateralis TaxID=208331 RepID=A0ABU7EKS9_9TELE|nr:hypothetical protein [Characodon lateralis]
MFVRDKCQKEEIKISDTIKLTRFNFINCFTGTTTGQEKEGPDTKEGEPTSYTTNGGPNKRTNRGDARAD